MIKEKLLIEFGAKEIILNKDDYLFHENDRPKKFFQVKTGLIKMHNLNADGKLLVQGSFIKGESFGEPPLFSDSLYPACAFAEEDTNVLSISKKKFFQLLFDYPEIHFQFTKALSSRLQFKSMLIKEISGFSPEHRILSLIDYLKKSNGLKTDEHFEVDITRQQIADFVGLRVETVIRTVKELEKQGELKISNRKIIR